MTVCNMSIEGGAKAGLVAPDETTFAYLQGREHAPKGDAWDAAVADWKTLLTDDDATFDVEVDIDAEDPPEPILGSTVDLGVLTTEFIAVGLDPYPRKPGVEFTPFIEDDGSEDEAESPFSGLAALKDKRP